MMRWLLALTALGWIGAAAAAGGGAIYHFEADVSNTASVQRGARNFMNYCSGCHSLGFLRYNRLGRDNAIPEDVLAETLMFTSDKPGDHIVSAMPAEASAKWFGRTPPDLSLTARARGVDWIYSFLKTFYIDESKSTGVNNLQLPGASMPHVLGSVQGYQALGHAAEGEAQAGGHGAGHGPNLELVKDGALSPQEYDDFVGDITNFLAYAAEPGKLRQQSRGLWTLLYIVLLLIPVTYLIKREFWKDIH